MFDFGWQKARFACFAFVRLADQLELSKLLTVTSGIRFLCWVSTTRFSVYFVSSSWQYAASATQDVHRNDDDKNPTIA